MLNVFAHMRHYLRLRWNEVVVVSRQNKKIMALVDTVLVAIGIGGTIQLDLRQSILPCTASGALIQVRYYFAQYSVPFTMIAGLLLTTLYSLLSIQREEDKRVQLSYLYNAMAD